MILLDSESLEDSEKEIGKRNLSRAFARNLLECSVFETSSGEEDWKIVVGMGIGISHTASKENRSMVEKCPIAV